MGKVLSRRMWVWLFSVVLLGAGLAPTWTVQAQQIFPRPLANPGPDCQPVSFTDDPDPVAETGVVTYTIQAKNNSAILGDDASATLQVTVPVGFEYLSSTTDHGTCTYVGDNPSDGSGDYLQCDLGSLGPLEVAEVTMDVRAPVGVGTYYSTATMSCPGDVNSANDSENNQTTVRKGADIQLGKAVDPTLTPDAGIVTYTITLDNGGPRPAPDLEFHDTLPVGVIFFADDAEVPSDDDALWSCAAVGQAVTCTYNETTGGEFEANASMVFHFRAQAFSGSDGDFLNNANVDILSPPFDQTLDPDPENNTAQATLTITPGTDLAITKSEPPAPVLGGTSTSFVLHVENKGPREASDVTVTDALPAGYTVTNLTVPSGWTCSTDGAPPVITCTTSTLPVNATADFTVEVTVPNVTTVETHTNQADITANFPPDPLDENNTATVTYEVYPSAPDLAMVKSKGPSPVAIGEPITNTMEVTNKGPVPATTVRVVDHLSSLESIDSATYPLPSGSPWDCTYESISHDVICDYDGALGPGETAPALVFTTIAQSNGPITNTAEAETPDDYNSNNDSDDATVNGSAENADLAVTKTVDDTLLEATEDTLTFTVSITNNGPDAAGAVTFDDEVPFYMPASAGRSATPIVVTDSGGGTCSVTDDVVHCEWSVINAGETVTMTYTVSRPMRDGTYVNKVCAYSGEVGDLKRKNNCSNADAVTVMPIADVEVTQKSVSYMGYPDEPVLAGTSAVYTIQVRNNGPSTAADVTLKDEFSGEDFTFLSYSVTDGGTCTFTEATRTLDCSLGDMVVDQTKTITVEIRPVHKIPEPDPWEIYNTATASTTTDELDTTNNSKSLTLEVKGGLVDVTVEKNESPDFTEPIGFENNGDNYIVYQIQVYNYGPSYATEVEVTDRVDTVYPYNGDERLQFMYDTANSDGTDDAEDWCTDPSPNPFDVNDTNDDAEPLVTCQFPDLEPSSQQVRYLVFKVLTSPHPIQGDVYHDEAHVSVAEDETDLTNNDEDENTTVRIYADLGVQKSGPGTNVEIYTPFNMTITVTNHGPGIAPNASLSDTLPAGMELTGTPTVVSDWGDTDMFCTGAAGETSFSCGLGNVGYDANHSPAEETMTITVPVMVTDPNTTLYLNTASASSEAPEKTPDPHPNTASTTVTMNPAVTLGDFVWYDQNQDGIQDPDEPGIDGVTVTLYASDDCSGAPYQPTSGFANPVTTGDGAWADGYYEFSPLPHGTYCVKFEVPSTVLDAPILSPQNAGGDDALDSDAGEDSTGVYRIQNIDLTDPTLTEDMTNDVGVFEKGALGDRVWCESPTNVNTTFDLGDGDAGVNDITVSLYQDFDCDGTADTATPLATTTTSDDGGGIAGYYLFSDLEIALHGDPLNQTCYVVEVDDTDPDLGVCHLLDTPPDGQHNPELDTDTPTIDTADFSFRLADLGDLPDTGSGAFATTLGDNGPYHLLDETLYLGSCADAESDAAPDDPDAGMVSGGDDGAITTQRVGSCGTGGDDEDGVQFVTPFVPEAKACVEVTAANTSGNTAYLYGWADWNGDGQFSAAERLSGEDFASGRVALSSSVTNQTYCFTVPSDASFANGDIHFRFRLTTDALSDTSWTGAATNGEVEDYWLPLACVGNYLWDDRGFAINNRQDSNDSGLPNVAVRMVWAGPDGTVDTSASDTAAQNDDVLFPAVDSDAEGRYAFCGLAPPSQTGVDYTFQVQVPPQASLKSVGVDAAVDTLDSDASPENTLGSGWSAPAFTLSFSPVLASGPGYLRLNGAAFPLNENGNQDSDSQNAVNYIDQRTDWTQDFGFLVYKDFGDLPETGNGQFATTDANNGPWHLATSSLYLGSCVDVETDGAPASRAGVDNNGGDDGNTGFDTLGTCATTGDDEDGLVSGITPAAPGEQACFQMDVHNDTAETARLYAWVDWDGDGQFQADEQLTGEDFGAAGYASIPANTTGTQTLCFTMPQATDLVFLGGEVHSRFRLTTEDLSARSGGDALWEGPAQDGEVEDYWDPLACVGNFLWRDDGATDDLQDNGDTPLSGVDVRLLWAGPNGVIDTAPSDTSAQGDDVMLATTTTDAQGLYNFCGLRAGATNGLVYQVQVPPVSGYFSIAKDAGPDDERDSDADPQYSLSSGWRVEAFSLQVDYTAPGALLEDTAALPTNEQGVGDSVSEANDADFPDTRTDWTQDLGFVQYNDYGDLPATFEGTSPATHPMRSDLYLGACVDADTTNAPDAHAGMDASGGDDHTAGEYTAGTCASPDDDEDGVTLVTPLVPGAEACVQVDARNGTGGTAYLYGWFDWNGNGQFDAGEQLDTGDFAGGVYGFSGDLNAQEVCFTVPADATFDGGETHMRFRLTTQDNLASPTGAAVDGEVEDYWTPLACVGNLVWNDSTGSVQDVQDAGDTAVAGLEVRLVYGGDDGDVDTAADSSTAAAGERLYTTTTDANGVYAFCGLTAGAYQVQLAQPPSNLPQAVTPDQGADDNKDADGIQSVSGGAVAGPTLTISDVTALPTGEDGNQDTGSAGYANNFPDNQVNESLDFGFRPVPTDYGDAPDTYGTTGTTAASHVITSSLYLGACVDAESDGQPNTTATGDDTGSGYFTAGSCATSGDDEDGVRLITPLVPGNEACMQVSAHNATGDDAYLYAWFDWNGDGDFDDAGEMVDTGAFATGAQVTIPDGGVTDQTYCFDVPADATFQGGVVNMRFRLSSDTLTSPTGTATDGEVEDYQERLYCAGNFVWNDGGSATSAVQDGTEPGISGVTLTLYWDGNDDGDFADPEDRTYTTTTDADGIYAFCGLRQDANDDGSADTYRVDVTVPSGLTSVAQNQGTDEALDSDGDAAGEGPTFTLPPNPDQDTATNDADPNAYPDAQTLLSVDFGFVAYDFGDLPNPYKTTEADGGPQHVILPANNPTLGSVVDAETDGQPETNALGDDNTDVDDEDGVSLPSTLVAGQTYSIDCTVSNASATTVVSAWFDWNGDGDFADADEQVLDNAPAASACPFDVTVPLDVADQVGVRFRVANEPLASPDGLANSGEVEDYLVSGQLTYDYGDVPDTFATLDASGGPKHQLNADLYLGACVDGDTDGQPDAEAGVDGIGGDDAADASDPGVVAGAACAVTGDDEDGVTLVSPLLPGTQACVDVTAHNTTGKTAYLYAWFDWNGDGQFSLDEQVNTGDFSGGSYAVTGTLTDQRLCFTVPSSATFNGGETHMRFRLTTQDLKASDWGGTAPDGEVEDYWAPLACVGNLVWDDTASTSINVQDASDSPVADLDLRLVWAGPNGLLETAPTAASAGGDDVITTTTTDAEGRYAFCGLTGDQTYQVQVPTLPTGLNQVVTADAGGDDTRDSDAQQPAGPDTAVSVPAFTVPYTSLASSSWVTGENSNQDAATQADPALTFDYPDGRTNLSVDIGFRSVSGTADKAMVDTNQTFTDGSQVAIGEIVTYEASLTLGPGTLLNVVLTDILDRGLAYMDCESITVTGSLTATAGTWDTICANPVVSAEPTGSTDPVDQGRKVVWNFGTVTNSGTTDATITVRYRVVVLDNEGNQSGLDLQNQATWSWRGGDDSASADPVTVVEPDLALNKQASPRIVLPDEAVTFTLTVEHTGDSETNAYDVILTDPLPSELHYVDASLTAVDGPTPASMNYDPVTHTITVTWDNFALGSIVHIQFQATLHTDPGEAVSNEASLAWSSLPGDVSLPQSAYNIFSTERDYDPASPADIYGTSATIDVRMALPDTGFAPRRVTPLPAPTVVYDALEGMRLEIPKLGVDMPIVGVPRTESGWDLTWLWDNAGWLEGTAFPTWAGNTALTAHVYLPDGEPGPFVDLHTLHWGDQVIIRAHGKRYVYEVRTVQVVAPDDASVLGHRQHDWLTLLTCQGYDEATDTYRYRLAVQAVLVSVQSEP